MWETIILVVTNQKICSRFYSSDLMNATTINSSYAYRLVLSSICHITTCIYVLHGVGRAGTGQRSSRERQGVRGWRGRPGDSSALSDQYPGLPPECQQSNYNGFCTIVHREIKWENGFTVFLYARALCLARTLHLCIRTCGSRVEQ